MLCSSQRRVIHLVIPLKYCSQKNRNKTALRACSSSVLEKISSVRLVFLLLSDDPKTWDLAAVEPSTCSTEDQDRAEPDTFDAEAAYVSTLHICAVRWWKFCSISANIAMLAERSLTVCSALVILEVTIPTASLRVLTWLSKSANPRASGNKISRSYLNCASIERWPIPSRSGIEPLGEPTFEDNGGDLGKEVCSAPSHVRSEAIKAKGMHKQRKLGCRHLDEEIKRRLVKNVVWNCHNVYLKRDSSWAKMDTDFLGFTSLRFNVLKVGALLCTFLARHCHIHWKFRLSPRNIEDFWILHHLTDGSMKWMPLNLRALSSFGFSFAHSCFSLFWAAIPILVQTSSHTFSSLVVAWIFVSLSPDHIYTFGILFFNNVKNKSFQWFVFLTEIWDCSVNTELINRNNCAKNSFNRLFIGTEVCNNQKQLCGSLEECLIVGLLPFMIFLILLRCLQTHTTKLLDAKNGRLKEHNQHIQNVELSLRSLVWPVTFVSSQRIAPFHHGPESCFQRLKQSDRINRERESRPISIQRPKRWFRILLNCLKLKFLTHPTDWNKCVTSQNAQCSTWRGFWILQISREVRVLKQSQSALFRSVSHMAILFVFTCVKNVWNLRR